MLGVLPYLHGLYLDAEDAPREAMPKGAAKLKVIAPAFPRISNHNDLDPLRFHPEVDFRFIGLHEPPPACRPDRAARLQGRSGRPRLAARQRLGSGDRHAPALRRKTGRHLWRFQMLGRQPMIHSGWRPARQRRRPGLPDCETTLAAEKQLKNVSGTLNLPGSPAVTGYEIPWASAPARR